MTTPSPATSTGTPEAGIIATVERMLLTETVRIAAPGPQVLDPDTGQYVPGPAVIVYEGPGQHRAAGGPGIVLRLEGQPYKDDGDGRYLLFTPLGAPVALEGNDITVLASPDPGAIGRTFHVLDPGQSGGMSVVRSTWMRLATVGEGA
ncbi:DUF6093 family protein [Kitasatospora cineracea]|uniref:DUF6093 family protein n=1 Tax=Kitasatospora cineracea TaxID=88074 RepID=UPI003689EA4B